MPNDCNWSRWRGSSQRWRNRPSKRSRAISAIWKCYWGWKWRSENAIRWRDASLLQQMDWRDSLYGYIGMQDHTLDPIIRPGSFVQIDSRQRTVPPVNWHDEHDRPVFFFE